MAGDDEIEFESPASPLADALADAATRLHRSVNVLDDLKTHRIDMVFQAGQVAPVLDAVTALEEALNRLRAAWLENVDPSPFAADLDELFSRARMALKAEGSRQLGAVKISKRAAVMAKADRRADLIDLLTVTRARNWLKTVRG